MISRESACGLLRKSARALAVTAATIAAGKVITGPLRGFPAEDRLLEAMAERRSPAKDRWATSVSTASGVASTIGLALASGGYTWARSGRLAHEAEGVKTPPARAVRSGRDARLAVAPLAAIALETAVFVSAAAVVRRPRPAIPKLGYEHRTSSFPSGHTGAAVALYWTWATMLRNSGHPATPAVAPLLRWVAPPVVAHARLYCAMHHPTDVAAGLLIGAWSAREIERTLLT